MIATDSSAAADQNFELAYRQCARSAFLLARHLGRSTEEAMDVVQDSALRAWKYRHKRTGDFRPWFLAIVFRQAHRRSATWLPLPATWDAPGPDAVTSPMDPELIRALRQLPPRQRAALWLRYCDDMSIEDVARIIACSEAAAKQLLMRGRDALRRRMQSRSQEVSR